MSRDLLHQLDAYFSEVDERQGPVTVDQVTNVMDRVRELPAPAPLRVRQRPKVWVAAAAAVMVVAAVGVVPLIVGSQDTDTPSGTEPPVSTAATPVPTTAATAPYPTQATMPTGGSIEVTVEGIEGRSGGHLAGVLFDGEGTLHPDERAIGGFAVRVDSDPFTATELVRTPVQWPGGRAGGGLTSERPLFPDVTEEVLVVEPGTYTVMLWLADTTISFYSRWVPALGPRNLVGCEVVFQVEEGQAASLTVTGGFGDSWGKRCTTAPYPSPTPTIPVVPSGLAPAIAAARADGVAFNVAEHDLCEWFTPDEIRSIVADAYQAEGVTYPIPATLTEGRRGDSFSQWGCQWAAGGATDSPNLVTFDLTFQSMSEEELGDNEEPIHRPPADWGVGDLQRDDVVLLPPLDAPNIYLASRDEPLLIGHIPAAPADVVSDESGFDAWVQTDVSLWLNSAERLRVQVRILNAMLGHMNWHTDTNT